MKQTVYILQYNILYEYKTCIVFVEIAVILFCYYPNIITSTKQKQTN